MRPNLYLSFFFCVATTIAQNAMAQTAPTLSNTENALISVKNGALLSVQGDVLNSQTASFDNTDTIALTGNWTNNANNNGFSNIPAGIVNFLGGAQRINGTSITRFYDLRLLGTNIKYGDLDVWVNGYLRLYDHEFSLDVNTVSVFNTALNAVRTGANNTFGFVSSLNNGGLSRATDQAQNYLFPVGSSLGTTRFRPIELRPETTAANTYKVRHANLDASLDNYDRVIREPLVCEVNPLYYNRIFRTTGTDGAYIKATYDINADGDWQGIVHWQGLPRWEIVSPSVGGFDNTYNLNFVRTYQAAQNFTTPAFALAAVNDSITLNVSANPVCAGTPITFTADAGYTVYNFYVNGVLTQPGADSTFTGVFNDGDVITVNALNADCIAFGIPVTVHIFQNQIGLVVLPQPACAGAVVTCVAVGNGFVNYNFLVNGISVQNGPNNVLSYTNFQNGDVVTVVGTDANCDYTSNPTTIQIYQNEISLAVNANPICDGNVATFTATSGFLNYNFFVNGSSVQNGTNSTYSTSSIQDGDLVYVVGTDIHCDYISDTISMVVYSNSVVLSHAPDTVCAGTPTVFTATGNGFINYEFFVNGTSVQSSANNTLSQTFNDGDVVTVIGTDIHCTYNSNPDTAHVYFNQIGLVASDTIICAKGLDTLTATPGFISYNFLVNGNSVFIGPNNVYITSTLQDNDTITVIGTDANCNYVSNQVIIRLYDNEVILTADALTHCAGEPFVFNATSGFLNYEFFVQNVSVQNGASNTYTDALIQDGDTIRVLAQDEHCLYEDQIIVYRYNNSISLSSGDTAICKQELATFTASPGFLNYEFFVSGISAQSGPDAVFNTTTLFDGAVVTVVGTDANCSYASQDSISVTVYNSVGVTIYRDTTIVLGNHVDLIAQVGGNVQSYTWQPTNTLNTGVGPTVTASPTETTVYTVYVESPDGCNAVDTVTVTVIPATPDVLLIPNCITPNNDGANDVWIIDNLQLFDTHDIVIVNRWGDAVFRSTNYENDFDGTWNGKKLPAGTYYYIIRLPNNVIYKGPFTIIRE